MVSDKVPTNLVQIARQMSSQPGGTIGRNAAALASGGTIGRQRSVISVSSVLPPAPNRKVVGNPSDAAVFNFCHMFKDIEETRREFPQLYIVCVTRRPRTLPASTRPLADSCSVSACLCLAALSTLASSG